MAVFNINNNRKDHCLRAAVDSIQSIRQTIFNEKNVFSRVLEHAAKLTESEYGIFLKVDIDGEDNPILVFKAGTTSNRDLKNPGYDQLKFSGTAKKKINTYWQSFLTKGQAVVHEAPLDQAVAQIFPGEHPTIKSALFIPITVRNSVSALVCLANSAKPYDNSDISRLRPLWAAFELAMRRPDFLQLVNTEKRISPDSGDKEETISHYYARQFFSICYASFNGIISVDENYCVTSFNSAAENIFQLKATEAIGRSLNYLVPQGAAMASSGFDAMQGTRVWRGLTGLRNGSEFQLDVSAFRSRFGGRDQLTFIVEDISERLESARIFRENTQRFAAITNLAPVGIIQVNIDWSCIYANEKMSELSGLSLEELSGQGWLQAIHEKDADRIIKLLKATVSKGEAFAEEFCLQTPLGKITWVKANARALYDEQGEVMGMLATVTDISAQIEVESQLRELAEYDPLTGLVNRTFFNSHLQQAFDSSTRHGDVVLFFMDLDGFKQINDSMGHDVGDELLKQVANRISKTVRKDDIVARLGGDEFTIVLTHLKGDYLAINVAQKIITKMQEPFIIDNQEIFVTVSIGISTGNEANSDRSLLVKQADIALYRAKALGRNNFQFFTPEMDAQARARMFLCNSLHRALNDRQFEVYYQPQFSFQTKQSHQPEIIGFEALLRWKHPEAGMITPERFIPLLEESSLINEVSDWVVNQAMQQMQSWANKGLLSNNAELSVNISARQMYDSHLPEKIAKAISTSQLNPNHVILEITETTLMENSEANRVLLKKLKDLGIQISLDDFGTGYSSLSYLKKFPIDQVKIDRSFVADILSDADDAAIVKAIIIMAKSLNLDIVAEGVDAENKLMFLRNLNCDTFQGYHLSKPLTGAQVESVLREQNTLTNQ